MYQLVKESYIFDLNSNSLNLIHKYYFYHLNKSIRLSLKMLENREPVQRLLNIDHFPT